MQKLRRMLEMSSQISTLLGSALGFKSNLVSRICDIYFIGLLVIVVSMWGLVGCSKDKNTASQESLICDCSDVPSDQHGSCLAPLKESRAQIRIEGPSWTSGASGAPLEQLKAAVGEWNQLASGFQVSSGSKEYFSIYSVENLGSYQVDLNNPRECNAELFGPGIIPVEILDRESWKKIGLSDSVPGITLRCSQEFTLANQRILILRDALETPQFQSILLHELGHVVGLDHSCQEGGGNAQYAGCDNVKNTDHPYSQAVMFPTLKIFQMSSGSYQYEKKERLLQNDQVRASCLQKR